MQNQRIPRFLLILPAAIAILAASTQAQSVWQGPSNGLWNDVANWTNGIPNGQDGQAEFTNSAAVNLDGITASLATLAATAASTNTVVISNGTINLDSSGGAWSISVAATGSLRLLSGLSGATNEFVPGLAKTGAGTLTFLGNTNDLTFDGPVSLNEGKILINQDGSLGQTGNDLSLAAGTVLIYGTTNASGSTTLNASRTITLPGGGEGGFETLAGHTMTIAGDVTNNETAANLRKYGTGTLILSGPANYGGRTMIEGGTLQLSTNTVLAYTNIQFLAGGTLNLGALTATIPALNLPTNTNAAQVATLLNGSLTINGDANQTFGASANGSGTDLSGLSTFAFNRSNRDFLALATGANITNIFSLARTGTNSITATNIRFGGGGANAVGQNTILKLGQANTLNAGNEVLFGFFQGSVNASFHGGLTNSTLTIRGPGGGNNPVTLFRVGQCNSGNQSTVGILDLTGGNIDVTANSIDIGAHIAGTTITNVVWGPSATGTLVMPAGSIKTPVLSIGLKTATAGNPQITGTLTQGGGTVEATTLYLGNNLQTNGTAIPRFISTYNLNGGLLRAAAITAGTGISGTNFFTNSVRRFNWSAGTIRPLNSSTNLLISGVAGTGGSVEIPTIGPATKTFTADGTNGITLSATTWLIANGGDVLVDPGAGGFFTNTGAITIGSGNFPSTNALFTNAANASITIASGTATLATDARIFGIGDRTNAGVTNAFNVSGANVNLGLTVNRMLVGNKTRGEVNVTGGSLVITGNQPIYVGGDISFGASGAVGVWTVSGSSSVNVGGAGAFVLGQNTLTFSTNTNTGVVSTNSSSNSVGILNLNGGTFTSARAITTGVNTNGTVSSGTVNLNGGTLAAGANVANLINVTTATVASNSTFDTGSFDSGIGQNLAGAGTLTVIGSGTLRLNGTNTPPVVVSAGATLGGTGAVGDLTVNGTLAPGTAATNGVFTATGSLSVPGTGRFRVFGNGVNDRLLASGGASLGGTVAVTVDDEYTPASGDTFDLVDGTISGTPALSLPALEAGLVWVTNNFTATGVLSVTNGSGPTNNYANWLTNYPSLTGPDALGTADPDGDSFVNNLEFAFDGNPTIGTPALLTVTSAGTNAVFNWVERKNPPGGVTYEVQKSTALTNGWTPATGLAISNSPDQTGILIPADYERKEFEVPASGKDFYRVLGTINN